VFGNLRIGPSTIRGCSSHSTVKAIQDALLSEQCHPQPLLVNAPAHPVIETRLVAGHVGVEAEQRDSLVACEGEKVVGLAGASSTSPSSTTAASLA
jgi:hypothetical protein